MAQKVAAQKVAAQKVMAQKVMAQKVMAQKVMAQKVATLCNNPVLSTHTEATTRVQVPGLKIPRLKYRG